MAEKTELEVLQDISKTMSEQKEFQTKEFTKLREEATQLATKHEETIKSLQEEILKKDGAIADVVAEVKELKAKGGRIIGTATNQTKTLSHLIAETINQHKDKFLKSAEDASIMPQMKIDTKTVGNISDSNLSGTTYLNYLPWQPGMEPTGQTRFRDIFPTFQSDLDYVIYPRANSPIGEGSFGRQATEGATKAQVDRDYTMVNLTLKPMAGYAIVSRQALRNIAFMQSWLPTSMMEQLMDTEDLDFANTLVAAATGDTTIPGGVTVAVDKIIYLIKNLRKKKYTANAVMIDPDVWAEILTYRSANVRDLREVITVDANGNVRVLGRPIYDVNWLTGRRILVSDTRKAGIVQSEGLTMRQSDSHASIFTSNEIAFLLERIEGLAIFRPDAHSTTTL